MIGDSKNPGLYLLATADIFDYIKRNTNEGYSIEASYFEIYCGKLFDLLNSRKKLQAREDAKQNINIVGLKRYHVENPQNLFEMISLGNSIRVTSTTGKNSDSSRSHAILQIYINQNGKQKGLLSFIDLAGNERGADTYDHDVQTRIDGAEISKSLLALKECIRALDQDKKHVPFRGSKLTMVLKDSFIGKCKTVMIGTVAPTLENCEYTLNTLRYADRVKELKRDSKEKIQSNNELFLPRQAGNVRRFNSDKEVQQDRNSNEVFKQLVKNNKFESQENERRPPKPINRVPQDRSNSSAQNLRFQNNLNKDDNSFSVDRNENSMYKRKLIPALSVDNNTMGQPIEVLEVKHTQLINKIIEDEERIIRKHTNHINLMESSSEIVNSLGKRNDRGGSKTGIGRRGIHTTAGENS